MKTIVVENCPETGICSVVKGDAGKVDLMPDEAVALREADSIADVRQVLAAADSTFAESLSDADLETIKAGG